MHTLKKMTRRDFVAATGGTLVSIGMPGTCDVHCVTGWTLLVFFDKR